MKRPWWKWLNDRWLVFAVICLLAAVLLILKSWEVIR